MAGPSNSSRGQNLVRGGGVGVNKKRGEKFEQAAKNLKHQSNITRRGIDRNKFENKYSSLSSMTSLQHPITS